MSWYYSSYPKSKPKAVHNGYISKGRRGKSSITLAGDIWIKNLEIGADSKRMSRGRSYLRRGQISDIKLLKGKISGEVQGSASVPYKVNISQNSLKPMENKNLVTTICNSDQVAIQLINRKFSKELNDILEHFSFYPNIKEIKYSCTCPDYGNPCKHVATILYAASELINENFLQLFLIRGCEPDSIMNDIKLQLKNSMFSNVGKPSDYTRGLTSDENDLNPIMSSHKTNTSKNKETEFLFNFVKSEFGSLKAPLSEINATPLAYYFTGIIDNNKLLNINEVSKDFGNKRLNSRFKLINRLHTLDEQEQEWVGKLKSIISKLSNQIVESLEILHDNVRINARTINEPLARKNNGAYDVLVNTVFYNQDTKRISPSQSISELMQIKGMGKKRAQIFLNYGIDCFKKLNELEKSDVYKQLSTIISEVNLNQIIRNSKSISIIHNVCNHENITLAKPIYNIYNQELNSSHSQKDRVETQELKSLQREKWIGSKTNESSKEEKTKNKASSLKELQELPGVGKRNAESLYEIGIDSLNDLAYHHTKFYDNKVFPNSTIDLFHKFTIDNLERLTLLDDLSENRVTDKLNTDTIFSSGVQNKKNKRSKSNQSKEISSYNDYIIPIGNNTIIKNDDKISKSELNGKTKLVKKRSFYKIGTIQEHTHLPQNTDPLPSLMQDTEFKLYKKQLISVFKLSDDERLLSLRKIDIKVIIYLIKFQSDISKLDLYSHVKLKKCIEDANYYLLTRQANFLKEMLSQNELETCVMDFYSVNKRIAKFMINRSTFTLPSLTSIDANTHRYLSNFFGSRKSIVLIAQVLALLYDKAQKAVTFQYGVEERKIILDLTILDKLGKVLKNKMHNIGIKDIFELAKLPFERIPSIHEIPPTTLKRFVISARQYLIRITLGEIDYN